MEQVAAPEAIVVMERNARLLRPITRPFQLMLTELVLGVPVVVGGAVLAAVLTQSSSVALPVGYGIASVIAAGVLHRVWNPTFRAAVELYFDKDTRDRREFRARTRSYIPLTARGAERWLSRHPSGPGRIGMLLALGRVADADVELATVPRATADDAFNYELLRQRRLLLVNAPTDTHELRSLMRDIPDEAVRRDKTESIAIFEAQLAVDQGREPLDVLARARADAEPWPRSATAPVLLAKWFLVLGILPASIGYGVALWLLGS